MLTINNKGEMKMYNNIKLEKGLYSITGKTFTQALEALDPDSNYAGTELAGLDAFERQLKRFDIRVKGADSDRVEKFFVSTESAVLFPEYVRRMIKAGMDEVSIIPNVAAAVTYTDSTDYRGLTVTSDGNSDQVSEAGTVPVTTVRLSATNLALTKYARRLSCSYESVRKHRLEAFGVILRNLGAAISRDVNKLIIDTLSAGAGEVELKGTSITYADLTAFWGAMTDCNMTTMVCSPAAMAEILGLSEMKYCIGEYMSGGTVDTPYGVTLVKSAEVEDVLCVGVDRNSAGEMVLGTDVIVDFDKLISTQCDEIAASVIVGFSKICPGAVKVLTAKGE
jgi:energy-converting hydrogenase Eha subunit B